MIEKTIAKSLSVIFHPIVFPIYGFLLLFLFDNQFVVQTTSEAKWYIFGIVFINTIFFPVVLNLIFIKRNIVKSYTFENRKDRFYPLVSALLFYIMTWYLISRLPIFPIYAYVLFLAFLLTVVATGINLFYKISLYSMTAAAFSAFVFGLSYLYNFNLTFVIIVSFVLTGLIASSRLVLKKNNPAQVYSGLIIGFLISLLSLDFLSKIV